MAYKVLKYPAVTLPATGSVYFFLPHSQGIVANIVATASAGAAGSITSPTTATFDSQIVGMYVCLMSGTGAGQVRKISAYNTSTRVISVDVNFSPAPDATTVFAIMPPPHNSDISGRLRQVAFMVKIATPSGTITTTFEASPNEFADLFSVPYDKLLPGGVAPSFNQNTGTDLGTAGNYQFVVRQSFQPWVRMLIASLLGGGVVTVLIVQNDLLTSAGS